MQLHIHPPPAKGNTFGFQAKALLEGRITPQLDLAASAQHAMPWQIEGIPQATCNLTRSVGKARRPRDCPVGRDLTTGDRPNSGKNLRAPRVLWKRHR